MINDPGRLEAVRRYGVLDTPREERFDRLTRIVARTLGVPVSLIVIADQDRLWFASAYGTDDTEATFSDGPRGSAFCAEVISHGQTLVFDRARCHRGAGHGPIAHHRAGAHQGASSPSPWRASQSARTLP